MTYYNSESRNLVAEEASYTWQGGVDWNIWKSFWVRRAGTNQPKSPIVPGDDVEASMNLGTVGTICLATCWKLLNRAGGEEAASPHWATW